MKTLETTAPPEAAGARLDAYLARAFALSRAAAERLLSQGAVVVTGGKAEKNYRLRGGERLVLTLPDPVPAVAAPEDIPLDVVYEDADIIVVNKPAGLVVHPAAGHAGGTLVNALLAHCAGSLSGIGGVMRPGIVHRIDKDTGGLLVAAKNDAAHAALAADLKKHAVARVYEAIAVGNFKEDAGVVNAPIGRHPTERKRMAVVPNGREAVTHFEVIERFRGFSHVRCRLETGRTHQIRVHLAHIGHPLLGDPVYGGTRSRFAEEHKKLLHGQCLFAAELSLTHPRTGESMTFHAPLPDYFEKILCILREETTK